MRKALLVISFALVAVMIAGTALAQPGPGGPWGHHGMWPPPPPPPPAMVFVPGVGMVVVGPHWNGHNNWRRIHHGPGFGPGHHGPGHGPGPHHW